MKTRSVVILAFLTVTLAASALALWLYDDVVRGPERRNPWLREVYLSDFPSEDAAIRSAIQRLSAELRQHTQDFFVVRWLDRKSGTAGHAVLYERKSKLIGYAYDADSGYDSIWTNVDISTIHTLAAKGGRLEDLRPKDWPE